LKDQYVGDVNDYLKYALLRQLTSDDQKLAVIWMRTSGDGRRDGRRLTYLEQPSRFRTLDPPLFDALQHLVTAGRRSVAAVEQCAILSRAVFVTDELRDGSSDRDEYMRRALGIAHAASVIFFDPDNGIDTPSIRKGQRSSSKYVYRDEIRDAYALGRSVVVYQHFPRRQRLPFLHALADDLRGSIGSQNVYALDTPHVAFLILPQPADERTLFDRLRNVSERAGPFRTSVRLLLN
jgi:hypothetical protein